MAHGVWFGMDDTLVASNWFIPSPIMARALFLATTTTTSAIKPSSALSLECQFATSLVPDVHGVTPWGLLIEATYTY